MKKDLSWKAIAELLYEAMGCSCCADYDKQVEAREAFRRKSAPRGGVK